MAGKLNSYLADIDKRARFPFDKTVKSLAEKENVTENSNQKMQYCGCKR